MTRPANPDLLADLARRLATRLTEDSSSFSWIFDRYKKAERLDDLELARQLGVTLDLLARIGICARPRDDHFREDITAVAERFGADPVTLARIVRQVDALNALYLLQSEGTAFLAAARDRVAEDDADYEVVESDADDAPDGDESDDRDPGAPR